MKKKISALDFFTLTGALIITVYCFPLLATAGFSLIFFLLLAALLYFIPCALVSAELGTIDDWGHGGIFVWCKLAFGKRWGFAAVFYQWIHITIGIIPMFYFIVGSLSYVLDMPALNHDPYLKCFTVVILVWFFSILNLRGTALTAKISNYGFFLGAAVPILVLLILVVLYLSWGGVIHVQFSWKSFFPSFSQINSITIFITFILSLAGIEASAALISKMKNAKKDYPKAILALIVLVIITSIIGSLSIAIIVPAHKINLSSGVVQTFAAIVKGEQVTWLIKIFAFILVLGAMAQVSSWIVGPAMGMFFAAKEGYIPTLFAKENKYHVPHYLILTQALIITIWTSVLTLCADGGDLSFMISIALAVVVYLVMYLQMFIAYFILNHRYSTVSRGFTIPGGKRMKLLVPSVGLITVLISIIVSVFPPDQIANVNRGEYETILVTSFFVVLLLPHILYAFRKRTMSYR